MIYRFEEYIPVIDPSSFVHPLAAVTGNVIIAKMYISALAQPFVETGAAS
jgi:carbonic anhydrase/acetyltransferase-like protein (isoleucine patch superfamily)